MKKHFLFLSLALLSIFSSSCSQTAASTETANLVTGTETTTGSGGAFKWEKVTHDFGKIKQGTPVTTSFNFTNEGSGPIQISAAKAPCGCTTPEWTREEVAPNGTGFVQATFNAATAGSFNKVVTVTSNVSENPVTLTITGEVVSAETVDFHESGGPATTGQH